jgi:hypothetical protein
MLSDLLSLPDDALLNILSHLTRREAARGARLACRSLRAACQTLDANPNPRGLHHRHRLFVANSATCEVVEMSVRGSDKPTRVAVGKAWRMSGRMKKKKKPKSAWLTGIAFYRRAVYCCQYQPSCVVVLDADDGLRYVKSYELPHPSPEGIACDGTYLYVAFAGGQIKRARLDGLLERTASSDAWKDADFVTPAWGQQVPCYMDRTYGHEYYNGHETPGVVWGAALGPDGALYVAADRDHDPPNGNYATPPTACAACVNEGSSGHCGTVFRASWGFQGEGIRKDESQTTWTPLARRDALSTRRPSGIAFVPAFVPGAREGKKNAGGSDAETDETRTSLLVASMDRAVSAFAFVSVTSSRDERERRTVTPRVVKNARAFLDLKARDEAGRSREKDFSPLPHLQPFDAHAPPFQGGRVFVTVHRGVEAGAPGSADAGVVVCDAFGNELAFVRDDAIAAHANALAGE